MRRSRTVVRGYTFWDTDRVVLCGPPSVVAGRLDSGASGERPKAATNGHNCERRVSGVGHARSEISHFTFRKGRRTLTAEVSRHADEGTLEAPLFAVPYQENATARLGSPRYEAVVARRGEYDISAEIVFRF
jgi:hypothetical protein